MKIRFDIVSANKDILKSPLQYGLISRALKKEYIEVYVHNLRDHGLGNYKQIDDTPYGGGAGMILKPEPFFEILKNLVSERKYDCVINFSPQGKTFNQKSANIFSLKNNFILICGHYKGIDERVIDSFVTEELSIGDYVISSGDIAALVFIDSVSRLIPGVLGDAESAITDTFQTDLTFDYPQYTRPELYEGLSVPKVLLNGNHAEITKWRELKSIEKFRKSKL